MKTSMLSFLFCLLAISAYSQDKRGYKGTVRSSLEQVVKGEGENAKTTDTEVEVEIVFDGRTIAIGSDVYEIIKREFDGKATTSYTCTKRRSTFIVSYKPGDFLRIVDPDNKTVETVFRELVEQ